MKLMNTTGLSLVLSALVLSGPGAFAQSSLLGSAAAGGKVTAAIDQSATVKAIQSASFDSREQVLVDLEGRMRSAAALLSVQKLSESAKKEIEDATTKLDASIRKARSAAAADWEQVRSELNDSFSAYAAVAVRVSEETPAAEK